ncbi:hypothetical protein GGS20DRAFT_570277, partial [Poronia punctata]
MATHGATLPRPLLFYLLSVSGVVLIFCDYQCASYTLISPISFVHIPPFALVFDDTTRMNFLEGSASQDTQFASCRFIV